MIRKTVTEKLVFTRKRDNYARKLRRQQLINYLRTELRTSTTHGLPYIVNKDIHWFERLFWSISFLTSATLAAYLLSAQFARFIEAPTVMSVEMDYFNWNVSYPAFTLCPYLKTTDASFGRVLNKTLQRTGRDLEAYLFAIVTAGMDTLDALDLQLEKPDILSLIDPNEYANIAFSAFRTFDEELLTTNMDMPVTITDVMTELGMCHVINSNVGVFDNPFKWYSNIKYRKTNIEISVYEKDFFTQIINYAEVYKVLIHSPDEIALSTTPSYSHYLRGFLTFGIQVSSIRISDNLRTSGIGLRKCRFTNEPISKRYPVYSYNHCLLECRIQMILKLCGCIPHFYKAIDDEKICNLGELSCVVKHKKEILTLSASEETLQKFNYNERLPKNSSDCGCLSNCEIDIYQKEDESLVPQPYMNRLRIGISSFPKYRIVRDIIFSFEDIILRIGGVVNLCIGTSIISLIEFLVMIVRIPIYKLLHFWKKNH